MYDSTKNRLQNEEILSISPENYTKTASEEIQTENIDELQTDWSAKCCCTSRVKFLDTEFRDYDVSENESSSGTQIIDEIANVISNYRRESVLNTISEFEKKLLTIGMAEELNPEGSDSERSEEELNMRRHSELASRPLVLNALENRRATAPDNIQRIVGELNIQISEDNTDDLIPDPKTMD